MARKPSRSKAAKPSTIRTKTPGSDRERIIKAFMKLLAVKPFEQIGFAEIAARSGVSLARLRDEFDSTLAIIAAQMKETDRLVLESGDSDMAEESPRDRLFDVLMRRMEALVPHKTALRSLMRSAMCNPGLALALNRLSVRSQRWMLTAADISASGPKGAMRAQGLALIFARVLRVWLNDSDPGHARSMAELDRALTRGQSWSRLLDDVCAVIPSPRRSRHRRSSADEPDEAAAA